MFLSVAFQMPQGGARERFPWQEEKRARCIACFQFSVLIIFRRNHRHRRHRFSHPRCHPGHERRDPFLGVDPSKRAPKPLVGLALLVLQRQQQAIDSGNQIITFAARKIQALLAMVARSSGCLRGGAGCGEEIT